MGFALGIVRVQYRFFIGTVAKRSPEKPDPCVAWRTPKSNLIGGSALAAHSALAFTPSQPTKYDTPLKLIQIETFTFSNPFIHLHERFSFF
ncbi:hypothetical protein ASG14_14350 [Pedobacter sp. Leaf194]|nr:hypothetical protein ASG14_14350 [Pedobacter sp. Leaf194]